MKKKISKFRLDMNDGLDKKKEKENIQVIQRNKSTTAWTELNEQIGATRLKISEHKQIKCGFCGIHR